MQRHREDLACPWACWPCIAEARSQKAHLWEALAPSLAHVEDCASRWERLVTDKEKMASTVSANCGAMRPAMSTDASSSEPAASGGGGLRRPLAQWSQEPGFAGEEDSTYRSDGLIVGVDLQVTFIEGVIPTGVEERKAAAPARFAGSLFLVLLEADDEALGSLGN